jgi:hypothetical protein
MSPQDTKSANGEASFVIPSGVEESLIFKMNRNQRCFDCAALRFAPLNMTSNE